MHACEPSLAELKEIRSSLFREESTNENMAKIKAIAAQITRHEKALEPEAEEVSSTEG